MGFQWPKHWQQGLRGTEKTRQNEGRLSDFLDPIEPGHRDIQLRMCAGLQEKGRITPKAIQRSSGLLPLFQRVRPSLWLQQARWPLPEVLGVGLPCRATGGLGLPRALRASLAQQSFRGRTTMSVGPKCRTLPLWVWKMGIQQKRLRFYGIYHARLLTCLACLTSSFFSISLLEWECLSYASPTIVFWKNMICLISQVYSKRRILNDT